MTALDGAPVIEIDSAELGNWPLYGTLPNWRESVNRLSGGIGYSKNFTHVTEKCSVDDKPCHHLFSSQSANTSFRLIRGQGHCLTSQETLCFNQEALAMTQYENDLPGRLQPKELGGVPIDPRKVEPVQSLQR